MNRAQIRVHKQPHEVGLGRLLEGGNCAALETKIGLEVLCDLSHQPLKRQLSDQQLRALLVLPDLPERHRAGVEPVGLLHSAGRRRRLPSRLGCQLLPRCLASYGFAGRFAWYEP